MKQTKLIIIFCMLLIALPSIFAVDYAEQQTGNNGTTGITNSNENRAMCTKFVANASYDLCGVKYKFQTPQANTKFNITIWNDGGTNPGSIVHTFTNEGGTLEDTYFISYYDSTNCSRSSRNSQNAILF